MKYDQFYYSWALSGISQYNKKGGYGIAASSNGGSDFLRKCESIALNKKPELTGLNLVTEYFQYVESLKTYIFAGIYQIEAPEEMKGRDNSLAHVFVPAEPVQMDCPSSYIRKMEYTCTERLTAGMDILEQMEIPAYGFDYQALLKKYNLTDCSRLAVLLGMEFEGYFADARRTIVFPLDSTRPELFLETAREITWLLHSWVPDCLRKPADELRQKLGYVVAGSTSNKNCLCFVPENGEIENGKQRFDLRAAYDCNDKKVIARGSEFYYALAQRAQKSPGAVTGLIEDVCRLLPEASGKLTQSINRILDAYECYQIRHMEPEEILPDWNEANMKKKLDRAKKDDMLAKEYCIDYLKRANRFSGSFSLDSRQLKECWEALACDGGRLDVRFRPLVPVFLDMSFQFGRQQKTGGKKAYLDRLSLLDQDDEQLWMEMYERKNSCIHEHLSLIVADDEDGPEILEECLEYYGKPFGRVPGFRKELLELVQRLYCRHCMEAGARRKIELCVKENIDLFNKDQWEEFLIQQLPADSPDFCEKYSQLSTKKLKTLWLEKALENLIRMREELIRSFMKPGFENSRMSAEIRNGLSMQCRAWLCLAAACKTALDGKKTLEFSWFYEELKGKEQKSRKNGTDFYQMFMEFIGQAPWKEEEKDIRILAGQLELYGFLRGYVEEFPDRKIGNAGELEKYADGLKKHVLEPDKQKKLEICLVKDAMNLHETAFPAEKRKIRQCMKGIRQWEEALDGKFNCRTLEEFLNLSPDMEEDFPERWEAEHRKFARVLANYDAVMRKKYSLRRIFHEEDAAEAVKKNDKEASAESKKESPVKERSAEVAPTAEKRKWSQTIRDTSRDEGNQIILDFLNQ